jgi:phosphatidylinositol glycan class P protein
MSSKAHQKAINGFIFWMLSIAGLFMFIVWSSLEEQILHEYQFTYYPDKYWAVALPATFVMAFLYYLSTYFLMYMRNTNPLTSFYCITDSDARTTSKASIGSLADTNSSIPPISDIPVNVTSRLLYQPW